MAPRLVLGCLQKLKLFPFPFNFFRSSKTYSINKMSETLKKDAVDIFLRGVKAVSPPDLVKQTLKLNSQRDTLTVKDIHYKVYSNVYVAAFGKAVAGMCLAVENILGDMLVHGIASVPIGTFEALHSDEKINLSVKQSKIKFMEGAKNNLPDEASQLSARKIQEMLHDLTKNDILIVLISGGGSALLPSPIPPISLDDKIIVTKVLAKKGATIHELNTLRKHLSEVKGGGLAKLAYPAKVIGLILSDIIGDDFNLIASGPTTLDLSSTQDCLDIINKYNAENDIPEIVINFLKEGSSALKKDRNMPKYFSNVQNVLIGNNLKAVEGAIKKAIEKSYIPIVLSTTLQGEARDVANTLVMAVAFVYKEYKQTKSMGHITGNLPNVCMPVTRVLFDQAENFSYDLIVEKLQQCGIIEHAACRGKPLCILAAGETTVNVKSTEGRGGRNQEMALAAARCMHQMKEYRELMDDGFKVVFLSAGTDGADGWSDGPTIAAGASAHPGQYAKALDEGLNPNIFLENNDSYTFYNIFNEGKEHLILGLTGTNVMDLQVILLYPPEL